MIVKDIMLTPYTIHADSKLKDVVKYFINKKVTGSIVINSQKDIVGILSDKDIYRGLYPSYVDFTTNPELYTDFEKQESRVKEMGDTPIKNLMTKKVITTKPEDNVMKVGALMLARNVHRFPVVDDKGRLIGTISRGHIYRSLFRKKFDF